MDEAEFTKPQIAALFLLHRPQIPEELMPGVFNQVAKLLINFVLPLKTASEKSGDYGLDAHGVERLDPASMSELAMLRNLDLITSQVAKEVVEILWAEWSGRSVLQILTSLLNFEKVETGMSSIVASVIAVEDAAVLDYRNGKKAAFGRLMGACMKQLGKGADPQNVKTELERQLDS